MRSKSPAPLRADPGRLTIRCTPWRIPGKERQGAKEDRMYFAHFGLKRPPFEDACDDNSFYIGDGHSAALSFLRSAFSDPQLLVVLTGPSGSGKTATLERFLASRSESVIGGWLDYLPATADEFLEAILGRLGFQPAAAAAPELRSILGVFLGHQAQKGAHVVIAARIAGSVSTAVVEELAWLATLEPVREGRVKVLLVGDDRLDRVLDSPRSRVLSKLIRHRHRMEPLSLLETADYLEHRLEAAGSRRPHEPFTDGAAARIFELSGGLPPRINSLAESALGRAWKAGQDHIDAGLVGDDTLPAAESDNDAVEPPEQPVLILRREGGQAVRRVLDRDRILVGRHRWNDLCLDHASVSRHHGLLVYDQDQWIIVDLNSTNGVRVNGRTVKTVRLADGDQVVIGEFSGVFRGKPGDVVTDPEETFRGTIALDASR